VNDSPCAARACPETTVVVTSPPVCRPVLSCLSRHYCWYFFRVSLSLNQPWGLGSVAVRVGPGGLVRISRTSQVLYADLDALDSGRWMLGGWRASLFERWLSREFGAQGRQFGKDRQVQEVVAWLAGWCGWLRHSRRPLMGDALSRLRGRRPPRRGCGGGTGAGHTGPPLTEPSTQRATARNNPIWPQVVARTSPNRTEPIGGTIHSHASRKHGGNRASLKHQDSDRNHLIDHARTSICRRGCLIQPHNLPLQWDAEALGSVKFPPQGQCELRETGGDGRLAIQMRCRGRLTHGCGRPFPGFVIGISHSYRQPQCKTSCRPFFLLGGGGASALNCPPTQPCKDGLGSPDCQDTDRG